MFRPRPLAETRRAPDNLTTIALDGTHTAATSLFYVTSRRIASRCVTLRRITAQEDSSVIGCRSVDLDAIPARYVEATVSGRERVSHGGSEGTSLRRDETVGRRPGRHVSRVLNVQIDVLLRLAEEMVYLLHGAERTDLLLGAVGDEPPGGARRPPAVVIINDVRIAVRVDRARSRGCRS